MDRIEYLRGPIRRPHNSPIDPLRPAVPPPATFGLPLGDIDKGKGREDVAADSGSDVRRCIRRWFHDDDDDEGTAPLLEAYPASSIVSNLVPTFEPVSTAVESAPFEFTFRVTPNGNPEQDIREPVPEEPAQSWE